MIKHTISAQPEEFAVSLPFRRAKVVSLAQGAFPSEISQRRIGDTLIERRTAAVPCMFYLSKTAGRIGVAIPDDRTRPPIVNGQPLAANTPLISLGVEDMEVVKQGRTAVSALSVGKNQLAFYMGNQVELFDQQLEVFFDTHCPNPLAIRRIRQMQQSLLNHDHQGQALADTLDNLLFETAGLLQSCYPSQAEDKAVFKYDRLKRLTRFLKQADMQSLSIKNLLQDVYCSPRTLRNLTREFFGLSPRDLLIAHRMHLIRYHILSHKPSEPSLKGFLVACGVTNYYRFRKDYLTMFGEAPEQTLHHPIQLVITH